MPDGAGPLSSQASLFQSPHTSKNTPEITEKNIVTQLGLDKIKSKNQTPIQYGTDCFWKAVIHNLISKPKFAKKVRSDRFKPFWEKALKSFLPNTDDINPEGQLQDTRHPFDILAGKFCAYKGWSIRGKTSEPNKWLERGAGHFGDYLCCDRLCYLTYQGEILLNEGNITKAFQYGSIAALYHGSVGLALYAEIFFQVGCNFFTAKKGDYETGENCVAIAAAYLQCAIKIMPQSKLLKRQALTVQNCIIGEFKTSAVKPTNPFWERETSLEETHQEMEELLQNFVTRRLGLLTGSLQA